jgi:hypothetical protein
VFPAGRHHRLSLVGLARSGWHRAGRSRFHWNLRVGRRLLPRLRYKIALCAVVDNVLSAPAKPGTYTLVVLANGRVHAAR